VWRLRIQLYLESVTLPRGLKGLVPADPGFLAVSPQVTNVSHKPDGRLSLPSAKPAATLPVDEHRCLLAAPNYAA